MAGGRGQRRRQLEEEDNIGDGWRRMWTVAPSQLTYYLIKEVIAIGRSFALMDNEQVDGNKEMIAFGLMNIIGSFTSCYLTTRLFSKTAVNYNAGCKTQLANVVMSFCMMLTLLFLAPVFRYTPLVALLTIIMSAMLGLIEYHKAYHLYKTDKFDFVICMVAFFGVAFISLVAFYHTCK
nr:probable sulfate transporter 3.5 [Tanacetum cinerariifolium]